MYVIGLQAVQFGCQKILLNLIISKLDKYMYVVLLLIKYYIHVADQSIKHCQQSCYP